MNSEDTYGAEQHATEANNEPEEFDDDDTCDFTGLSQIVLVCGITEVIETKCGVKSLTSRQLNAVIRAADDILAELQRDDTPATPGMGYPAWLACDDTGISSKYIACVCLGDRDPSRGNPSPWPHDSADFGRCVRLLYAVPEFRKNMALLLAPEHGPVWNAIAAEWDTLEAWYLEDVPTGRSERVTNRLRELSSPNETVNESHSPPG